RPHQSQQHRDRLGRLLPGSARLRDPAAGAADATRRAGATTDPDAAQAHHGRQRLHRVPALRHELTARQGSGVARKTPSGPSPVAVGATANETAPPVFTLTTGRSVSVAMRAPPGRVSPTPTTRRSPSAAVRTTMTGLGPSSTGAANAMAPDAPTAGQRPKFENRPPPGAGSPSRATTRGRPTSIAKMA